MIFAKVAYLWYYILTFDRLCSYGFQNRVYSWCIKVNKRQWKCYVNCIGRVCRCPKKYNNRSFQPQRQSAEYDPRMKEEWRWLNVLIWPCTRLVEVQQRSKALWIYRLSLSLSVSWQFKDSLSLMQPISPQFCDKQERLYFYIQVLSLFSRYAILEPSYTSILTEDKKLALNAFIPSTLQHIL